jgi:fatty acid synthase
MDESVPEFSLDDPLYKTQLKKDLALNVFKNNVWGSYRHLLLEPPSLVEVHHCYVNTTIRGDLSSLKWFTGPIVPFIQKPEESKLVHVYYTALNFRDIMLATAKLAPEVIARGRINQESVIGFEYTGRTERGDRVMGMISSRALTNILEYDPYLSWKVPDHWSMEEAATVPVVYGTV